MKPIGLQNQFSAGMKRDGSRNRMQPNSCWNMVDIILDYDAPARGRAGWAYNATSVSSTSATYTKAGIYTTFSLTSGATDINMFADEDGRWWKAPLSGATSATAIAQGNIPLQNPVFHGGAAASAATAVYTGLIIIPDYSGTAVPNKYDGVSLTSLGGNPPKAKYAAVYKDYTVLGNGQVGSISYPNRVWFSPAGDPDCGFSGAVTAWDTTDSWIDFSLPIVGLASTKNVMLVFHDGQISRIRGNTPPPEEDMVVDDPWQKVGLLDAFSITEYQDQVFWAAPEGVFGTDGVSLNDYTLKGGMLKYWLDLLRDNTIDRVATGIIRNKLVVTLLNGTTLVDAFLIDLQSYAWSRLSNLHSTSFWSGQYGNADETYFGLRDEAKTARLSTIFSVGNVTYAEDGDGIYPSPILEPPFFELGRPGIKTVKAIHIGNYMNEDGPYPKATYGGFRQGVEVWYTDGPEENFDEVDVGGDFQSGLGSWTSPYATLSHWTGGARYGLEALETTATTAMTADSNMAYRAVNLPSAGRWTFSAWVYLQPETWDGGYVRMSGVGNYTGATLLDETWADTSKVNVWQRIELVFTAVASDLNGFIAFYPQHHWDASGLPTAGKKFYIDGIRVMKNAKFMGVLGGDPEGTLGFGNQADGYDRKRLPVGGRFYGIGLQLKQFGAGDLYGYDISAEVGYQEESKRLR